MSLTNLQKGQTIEFRKDPDVAAAAVLALATVRKYSELQNSSTLGLVGRALEMGATTSQEVVAKLTAITADFRDRIDSDNAVKSFCRSTCRPDEIY